SRRRHTRFSRDWSSDVCSSDLPVISAQSLPSFDNSAMDGFSLRAPQGLVAGVELDVAGTSVAGGGQAWPGADAQEVMTGAYMPEIGRGWCRERGRVLGGGGGGA